jgi:hypothetical protein
MAHFAKIGENNIVEQVIVVSNNECLDANLNESEAIGADFCSRTFGGTWIQTSYNSNFRKNFASAGFVYDNELDAFIPPKPYNAWVLNEETCLWEAPTPQPEPDIETNTFYHWDSDTTSWEAHTIEISVDSA